MLSRNLSVALLLFFLEGTLLYPQVETREEEIREARRQKMMMLAPERQSPLVTRVNDLVEKGLLSGFESGKGANGLQILLGGLRTGQGMASGIGYRRTDLWRDRLDFRTSMRGTLQQAYLFDFAADFPRLARQKSFLDFYAKYENSPQMDYFGPGADSEQSNRTSYHFRDASLEARGGLEVFRNFSMGVTGGWLGVETGSGQRDGVPSIEDVFDPVGTPGLGEDADFLRWGGFLEFDSRDAKGGPKSGGHYSVQLSRYSDRDSRFSFQELGLHARHYFPYFNRKRVLAVRMAANLTSSDPGQVVPYFLQPSIGGPDSLRGFGRYRFHGNHSLLATVEHRWHAFSGMDVALFVDAGKVALKQSELDFKNLELDGGIGFRFRVQNAVVMRIDIAASNEDFRWMWTFDDIF